MIFIKEKQYSQITCYFIYANVVMADGTDFLDNKFPRNNVLVAYKLRPTRTPNTIIPLITSLNIYFFLIVGCFN